MCECVCVKRDVCVCGKNKCGEGRMFVCVSGNASAGTPGNKTPEPHLENPILSDSFFAERTLHIQKRAKISAEWAMSARPVALWKK